MSSNNRMHNLARVGQWSYSLESMFRIGGLLLLWIGQKGKERGIGSCSSNAILGEVEGCCRSDCGSAAKT